MFSARRLGSPITARIRGLETSTATENRISLAVSSGVFIPTTVMQH